MTTTAAIPITGSEADIDPRNPTGALAEFYSAFNGRDLALMEQNWLSSDDASMNNPLGGVRRGWPEIRQVYARIFDGPASVRVEFHNYTIHQFGRVFLAVGRERGTLKSPRATLDLNIRTSRFFVMLDGRWHQFHHHGSFDDAGLLERYQAAILTFA